MDIENLDWETLADRTCQVLTISLKPDTRKRLELEAKQMNGTFEGLVAAAIIQTLKDDMEKILAVTKPKVTRKKAAPKKKR